MKSVIFVLAIYALSMHVTPGAAETDTSEYGEIEDECGPRGKVEVIDTDEIEVEDETEYKLAPRFDSKIKVSSDVEMTFAEARTWCQNQGTDWVLYHPQSATETLPVSYAGPVGYGEFTHWVDAQRPDGNSSRWLNTGKANIASYLTGHWLNMQFPKEFKKAKTCLVTKKVDGKPVLFNMECNEHKYRAFCIDPSIPNLSAKKSTGVFSHQRAVDFCHKQRLLLFSPREDNKFFSDGVSEVEGGEEEGEGPKETAGWLTADWNRKKKTWINADNQDIIKIMVDSGAYTWLSRQWPTHGNADNCVATYNGKEGTRLVNINCEEKKKAMCMSQPGTLFSILAKIREHLQAVLDLIGF